MTIEDQTTSSDVVTCGATRRHALTGMAVAVGAFCAACSSSGSKGASASPTTGQTDAGSGTAMSSSSSPTASGSSSDTAASSSGPESGSTSTSGSGSASGSGGTALAPVSAVPVGGGKILTDQSIVLTQPSAGTIKAFSAVCTHQGCTVTSVDNSVITCPCHGSQFKITDGSVANGPATRPLAAKQVKVENGQIMLVS